ncbi:MAG TPA: hypothetical protein VM619_02490 [Luteimonas sp.]|nr:hypothetical protein [Luteimonas sp.]
MDAVQVQGKGWRARCPACGGRSRKLSVAESDSRVLVHCFGGCKAIEVLEAVGLTWADIMPPRHWPESPEERRMARRAMKEAGWAAALAVLSIEAQIVNLAAQRLKGWGYLSEEDDKRLAAAADRIADIAVVMTEVGR